MALGDLKPNDLCDLVSFYEKAASGFNDIYADVTLIGRLHTEESNNLELFASLCVLGCYLEGVNIRRMLICFFCYFFERVIVGCHCNERFEGVVPSCLLQNTRWLAFCFGNSPECVCLCPSLSESELSVVDEESFPLYIRQSLASFLPCKEVGDWDETIWLSQVKILRVSWKNASAKVLSQLNSV